MPLPLLGSVAAGHRTIRFFFILGVRTIRSSPNKLARFIAFFFNCILLLFHGYLFNSIYKTIDIMTLLKKSLT
jgi:uncharacterized protein with PQ loop repeat